VGWCTLGRGRAKIVAMLLCAVLGEVSGEEKDGSGEVGRKGFSRERMSCGRGRSTW
jgi:hypothetical protein